MKDLVLLRSVHANRLRRAIVGYLVVESSKLRYLDEVSETLLLYDVVGDVKLEVGGFLGEDCRPRIKTADVLTLQFLGAQVLESRYNSVSELLIVVPDRNVAPKSLPVRSCMVRMAKSMLSAFWLPSLLPSPATRS